MLSRDLLTLSLRTVIDKHPGIEDSATGNWDGLLQRDPLLYPLNHSSDSAALSRPAHQFGIRQLLNHRIRVDLIEGEGVQRFGPNQQVRKANLQIFQRATLATGKTGNQNRPSKSLPTTNTIAVGVSREGEKSCTRAGKRDAVSTFRSVRMGNCGLGLEKLFRFFLCWETFWLRQTSLCLC